MTKRNDPRLIQNCKMFLKSWLAKCNLKIVLDEEQAIRYLMKYASKPEARSEDVNGLLRSLVSRDNETGEE